MLETDRMVGLTHTYSKIKVLKGPLGGWGSHGIWPGLPWGTRSPLSALVQFSLHHQEKVKVAACCLWLCICSSQGHLRFI